jgi:uncharacterized protein YdhG (YjbR/CyaY superfamily)
MTTNDGDRSQFFPAIEKKHGLPVSHWLSELSELGEAKYPEQIAYLRENHGFSQAHANAVVMHFRGSTTSKRFSTPKQYFAQLDPQKKKTAELIFSTIMEKYPKLELVIAWNQPMLRIEGKYVFGLSTSKNHLTLNPFSTDVLESMESKLSDYTVNKKTFIVPVDWKVDASLLRAMVKARLAE